MCKENFHTGCMKTEERIEMRMGILIFNGPH
jgi:hypothetical protein